MNLEFEITGQILKRIDSHEIMSKNRKLYKCRFIFEEESEWDNVNKFAIFTDGWGNSSTVHLGKSSNILSCLVPEKVLQGSYFKISLYGGDLITTNNVTVALLRSGYHKYDYNPNHYHKPYPPIPHHNHSCYEYGEKDIFVEIFNRLDKHIDSIVYEDNTLLLFSKEDIIDSVYLPFLNEEDARNLANSIVEEYVNNIPLASNTNHGLLSKEDKNKLDSIEDCATNVIVDTELNINSNNAISNSTVTDALDGKENSYDFVERIDNLIVDLINNEENI